MDPEKRKTPSTPKTARTRPKWSRPSKARAETKLVPYADALAGRFADRLGRDRNSKAVVYLGPRAFADYSLEELAGYIDWQPFFWAWELRGKFPDVLDHPAAWRRGPKTLSPTGKNSWTKL